MSALHCIEEDWIMTGVRVLVGTRKGAFILTSDAQARTVGHQRPALCGLGDLPPQGIPCRSESAVCVAIDRLVRTTDPALQRRRQNLGAGRATQFVYDGVPGTHQWYDGTQHPWEFKRVWHLEPSLTDPDTVYAGVEDAALFRSSDGGQTWQELSGSAQRQREPVAARRGRDVPAHDHSRSKRPQTHFRRHLGGRRFPHRRRRPDVAPDQPRPEVALRAA